MAAPTYGIALRILYQNNNHRFCSRLPGVGAGRRLCRGILLILIPIQGTPPRFLLPAIEGLV
jgi:hypothetical protein